MRPLLLTPSCACEYELVLRFVFTVFEFVVPRYVFTDCPLVLPVLFEYVPDEVVLLTEFVFPFVGIVERIERDPFVFMIFRFDSPTVV